MQTGAQYHAHILASRKDQVARERFQKMALGLLLEGADVLDFGAGTGIDAKAYAAKGHRTFVYEPSQAMREHLMQHCREEVERGAVIAIDLPLSCKVQGVTANFAVLNHFEEHAALFEDFARVVKPGGFVLASLLSPYYIGDVRHGWWRANLLTLLRRGHYPSPGESRIHRFAPRVLERAAAPHFRLERLVPRGLELAARQYMFLLFRRT